MASENADQPTLLLQALRDGDDGAAERLLPLVYRELRRVAGKLMRGERDNHTLQPTALIHEAFFKLIGTGSRDWQSRSHFVRVAARAMRQVLVDHARGLGANKRGGDRERVPLDGALTLAAPPGDVIGVDEALQQLRKQDERLASVVELRFFGGLDHPEIAEALDISLRTVERSWRLARAWLVTALNEPPQDAS